MPLYLNFTTTTPDNVNPGRPVFENIILTNDNLMVLYASREEDPTTVAFIS